MKAYLGVDLGSTATKAVLVDGMGQVLGRGITNSRADYGVAVAVARAEAEADARMALVRRQPGMDGVVVAALERHARLEQHLEQLAELARVSVELAGEGGTAAALTEVFVRLQGQAPALFLPGASRRSEFFRDLAGAAFMREAEELAPRHGVGLDTLLAAHDKAMVRVEAAPPEFGLESRLRRALDRALVGHEEDNRLRAALEAALAVPLEVAGQVGTGYGRVTLPFPRKTIRSEILCHGLGAHVMFPGTRTVLDIGGQDTKAIQVDGNGIVEGFQMNDRCAAGCGRYLGYIADEMNVGVQDLGPMALEASRVIRVNATCTVFAGAEVRDRLALGDQRADVLAGLHRAIMLRAMSIVARAGGARDQFTFTGGVAANPAAVQALETLIREAHGDIAINIAPDSIYTGALGAALLAARAGEEGRGRP